MAGVYNKIFGLNQRVSFLGLKYAAGGLDCTSLATPVLSVQKRGGKRLVPPKLKFPLWFLQKERAKYPEHITRENESFIKEVIHDTFGPPVIISGIPTYQTTSPLKTQPLAKGEWTKGSRRCGLITRKLGCYPMWSNSGQIIWSTLLQVVDNHVVRYTPPEEVDQPRKPVRRMNPNKFGIVLVGAESADPQRFTREYCGLFAGAGLPPKRVLAKFSVTPNAALQPGTPLLATHFQPGEVVDVAARTVDRGFQGVMKRWGFKGMPATHGVTKTHRRGGNTGGGGEKGRIWPGTKIPGFMGNRWRVHRGLKIWRVNTKYNVLYVQGRGVPGGMDSVVHVYDTLLPLRWKPEGPAHFPTFDPESTEELPEDLYDEEVHQFSTPTITFDSDK